MVREELELDTTMPTGLGHTKALDLIITKQGNPSSKIKYQIHFEEKSQIKTGLLPSCFIVLIITGPS